MHFLLSSTSSPVSRSTHLSVGETARRIGSEPRYRVPPRRQRHRQEQMALGYRIQYRIQPEPRHLYPGSYSVLADLYRCKPTGEGRTGHLLLVYERMGRG